MKVSRWSVVRIRKLGGVAQLGERLPCTQEVIGSIPFTSTKLYRLWLIGHTLMYEKSVIG